MTRPPLLESFFIDGEQRFAQRVDQRRRDRVVILPSDPEALEQRQIEIETAAGDLKRERACALNVIGASPDGAPMPFCVQL